MSSRRFSSKAASVHRPIRAAAAALAAVALAGCSSPDTQTTHATKTKGTTPSASSFDGLPQVGALFAGSPPDAIHFCTASVVDSPGHDLLVTAAHCISGTGAGLTFVPMYRDGNAPYGTWSVESAYVGAGWLHGQDPQQDVAFLAVAPEQRHGRRVDVQDLTGGVRLVTSRVYGLDATVVGYPLGANRPITCTNVVTDTSGFPTFACNGYPDGTSGSPWITGAARTDARTSGAASGPGDLQGVIGGLRQGGCTPQISYSSYFDTATAALFERAARGGPGDTVPSAGSDGC
jgi:Trypsin-like peptidase domain